MKLMKSIKVRIKVRKLSYGEKFNAFKNITKLKSKINKFKRFMFDSETYGVGLLQ